LDSHHRFDSLERDTSPPNSSQTKAAFVLPPELQTACRALFGIGGLLLGGLLTGDVGGKLGFEIFALVLFFLCGLDGQPSARHQVSDEPNNMLRRR
jgi:hypothetical protein